MSINYLSIRVKLPIQMHLTWFWTLCRVCIINVLKKPHWVRLWWVTNLKHQPLMVSKIPVSEYCKYKTKCLKASMHNFGETSKSKPDFGHIQWKKSHPLPLMPVLQSTWMRTAWPLLEDESIRDSNITSHCHFWLPKVSFTCNKTPNIILINANNKHG